MFYNNRKFSKVFLLAFLIFFAGCASHQFPLVRPYNEPGKKETDRLKAQEIFIQARDFERRGVMDMAEHYYEMAYSLDSDRVLRDALVQRYIESGKLTQALVLIKDTKNNKDLDDEEKRTVSTIYIKMGDFEKASEVLEALPNKTDEELYSLGLLYESLNNPAKALIYYRQYFVANPQSIQMGYKIGKLLINAKSFAAAESLYNTMLEINGENPDIYVMIGGLRIVQGDTSRGMDAYYKALSIDSVNEDALRSAAQVYLTKNNYPKAIELYEKLYKYNSLGEVYGRTLAILYYYNKQYNAAEQLLNSLLNDAIDDYELHFYMGLVFEALEKNDLAYIEFEKTISIRNTYDDAWKEMCYLALREKKYDLALEITERYLKTAPDISGSWKLKGYVLNVRKEYTKSIDALLKAVALDTNDIYALFELGSAYERCNDLTKATSAFKKILKLHPDDPPTLNYLGFMWAEKGLYLDSAKILIEKALKADPDNGAFLDSYAWVFYQMGNVDSAYKYMQLAVKKIDNDPVVYEHLGEILYKKSNTKAALEAFKKCLALDPDEKEKIRNRIAEIENLLKENGTKK